MQSFRELLLKRQSCRNFDLSKPVEKETIEFLIEAAKIAPSACNSQPWFYTAVSGASAKKVAKALQGGGMNLFTSSCPVFIIVSEINANIPEKIASALKNRDFRPIDIGLSVSQLCLQAEDLGLSTCILGWFDEDAIIEATQAPGQVKIVIAVGYAKESDPLRKKARKSNEKICKYIDFNE